MSFPHQSVFSGGQIKYWRNFSSFDDGEEGRGKPTPLSFFLKNDGKEVSQKEDPPNPPLVVCSAQVFPFTPFFFFPFSYAHEEGYSRRLSVTFPSFFFFSPLFVFAYLKGGVG